MPVRAKGRKWQADVREGDKRHRPNFDTQADAKAWEAAAQVAIAHGRPVPNPVSFKTTKPDAPGPKAKPKAASRGGETLAAALEATRAKYWTPVQTNHADKVQLVINDVLKHFGETYPLADVDDEAINGYVEALAERGNSKATINKKLNVLSKTLRYAVKRGAILTMPEVERLSTKSQRTRYLTKEEERGFLGLFEEWRHRDAADVFCTMIDTGMRNSEVFTIRGDDVWWESGKVHIWRTKTDNPRTVPLTKRVRAIFERRREARGKGVLFPELDNFSYARVFNRARTRLGLDDDPDVVPYVARHTFASRLVERGTHLRYVMELMGHTNINQTMRYSQVSDSGLEDAIASLEDDDQDNVVPFSRDRVA